MNHKFITHLSCGLAIVLVLCAGVFGQGTYRSLRIYLVSPYYPHIPHIDTILLSPFDIPPQFGAQAQRSDDTTVWEIVTSEWSSDSNPVWRPYPPAIKGSGWIYARLNDSGNVLLDSVYVLVAPLTYDSLRIAQLDPVAGYVRITSLPPQSGQIQTLYVQAHRPADDLWVLVYGSWSYSDGVPAHSQSGSGQSWVFNAISVTMSGRITVTYDTLPPASIPVTITAGPPNSLVLYSQDLPPSVTNVPLANPPQRVTMMAGNTLTVAALFFDWQCVYLSTYDRSTISWSAMSLRPSHDILDTLLFDAGGGVTRFGGVKYFKPTRAYDTVQIIAARSAAILDTVLVVVQPGPADHIVLEKSLFIPYMPNPCDTLIIQANEQSASVYAILQDKYENVVAPYYATLVRDSVWSLHDSIGVTIPSGSLGELRPLRLGSSSDTGKIFAWDSHGFCDSCVVIMTGYSYIALRIVDSSGTSYRHHAPDTLVLNAKDSCVIYVQGQRLDDTMIWVDVSAAWEIDSALRPFLPGNGQYSHMFTLSPTDSGRGWIRVSVGGVTLPDSLWVTINAPSAVRDIANNHTRLNNWSVFSDNGIIRIHIPTQGTSNIKIYSLTGQMVASREVSRGDAGFQLPKGVYIIGVNNLLNGKAVKGKIVNK